MMKEKNKILGIKLDSTNTISYGIELYKLLFQ